MGSVKVAELTVDRKIFIEKVNLGMINEFKIICDAMNVDPFEVIEAASTKPFGFCTLIILSWLGRSLYSS